jgi:hypothetical protein
MSSNTGPLSFSDADWATHLLNIQQTLSNSEQALNGIVQAAIPSSDADIAATISQYIDHTQLKPDATLDLVDTLCKEAQEYRFKVNDHMPH